MKWSVLLVAISIGLVAGEGAWKENHEYKYKFVDKHFVKGSAQKEQGFIRSVELTIHPQSDSVLMGRITDASSTILSDARDMDARKSVPKNVGIGKHFQINLKNGVIDSLSVDRTMTAGEINNLKLIVSQFQVDTKAKNVMESMNNHLPDANTNNAFYTTMEPTVSGTCETTYDISRLPEYLAYANYGSIPSLSKYSAGEDVIEIKKHINTKNCREITGTNSIVGSGSLDSRIIITGSFDKYIIHSSVSENKMLDVNNFMYLSLESMKQINGNSNDNDVARSGRNMVDIGNLVYQKGSERSNMQ